MAFSNLAVTVRAEDIVTKQVVAVPLHTPDQPRKIEPALGAAVSVTVAPLAMLGVHDDVQLPPDQLTVPPPGPAKPTLSGYVMGSSITTACRSEVTVKVQGAVPVQGLAHPRNRELPSGAAVSVTEVP